MDFTLTWKAVANIVGLFLRLLKFVISQTRVTSIESVLSKVFATNSLEDSHLSVFCNLIWNVCWVGRTLVSTTLQGTWGRNGDMTIAFACDTKRSRGQRDCRKNHSQLSNFMIWNLDPLFCLMCLNIKSTLLPFIQKFRDVIFNGGYLLGLKLKGRLWK